MIQTVIQALVTNRTAGTTFIPTMAFSLFRYRSILDTAKVTNTGLVFSIANRVIETPMIHQALGLKLPAFTDSKTHPKKRTLKNMERSALGHASPPGGEPC